MIRLIEALKFVCSEFETAKEDPNYWYKEEVEPNGVETDE